MNNKTRRGIVVGVLMLGMIGWLVLNPGSYEPEVVDPGVIEDGRRKPLGVTSEGAVRAVDVLGRIEVKGRAPKTGYTREQFSNGWGQIDGCDARNVILARDLMEVVLKGEENARCIVLSGVLNDPYTGKIINFVRGPGTSSSVQIDHVVALSDAWQKGAQNLDKDERESFANDPLNLVASDGPTNQAKGDSDAASWLPPNKAFWCQYVARQISVKYKYALWVTEAEGNMMRQILEKCPGEVAVGVEI